MPYVRVPRHPARISNCLRGIVGKYKATSGPLRLIHFQGMCVNRLNGSEMLDSLGLVGALARFCLTRSGTALILRA
jgi:hypothetical protein